MLMVHRVMYVASIINRSKGVYNRVRLVLDLKGFYYLAAEYMDCNGCKGTYIAYDER